MSASAGRVLLIPKGAYNASATYAPLDYVTYTDGNTYVCKAATTGHAPTDTTYWQILVDNSGVVHTVDIANDLTTQTAGKVLDARQGYALNTSLANQNAKLSVVQREQMASYGYFGVEWDIDELMTHVRAGHWDKFAIGDYFLDTTSANEVIQWEIAGKNSYLHCGDTELTAKHIVCSPRDCLQTYYKYNSTNTNAGGYAASLMPSNLETEANKFSSKLQGYMTNVKRLENNKGAWAWAGQYDGGGFNQLPLFVGGNAHLLKGAGYQKGKAARMWYWTADPSAANTTAFCDFYDGGASDANGAASNHGVAPLIVLS